MLSKEDLEPEKPENPKKCWKTAFSNDYFGTLIGYAKTVI